MEIKVGMKCKQTKVLMGFDYRNSEFEVIEVNEEIITAKSGVLQFSISKNEFLNYFEMIKEEKVNFEIKDGIKIIRHDTATIVILKDGTKGVAKCLPEDKYDENKGYEIAFTKATIKSLSKKLKKLSR